MALVVAKDEEYENEGITSSDDSCDDQQQIEIDEKEGESTVCENDDNQKSNFGFTEKEKGFGIDLDLFGRFPPQKIPKKYGSPIYHYHVDPSLRDLKYIWNEIQCKQLSVRHLDNQYSLMSFIGDEHHKTNYNVITRREIWPINFQNKMYESVPFKYNLFDCNKYFKWCIILIMGGKFSIAIYQGSQCIYHKCERSYVVRNNHNGKRELNFLSNKTKSNRRSGGSQKRAWNEKHLKENIHQILSKLQDEIMNCHRIWIHAPSTHNKNTIFGERKEQQYLYPDNEKLSKQRLKQIKIKNTNEKVNKFRLSRKDLRINNVPITVHQATFAENKRVHHYLSTCWLNQGN